MASEIHQFLEACKGLRILVLGDLMLDRYIWGKVKRISPEAPVPIVDVFREENRLGGAANVALNLKALGAEVLLAGSVGQDTEGEILRQLAEDKEFNTSPLLSIPTVPTTVKTRIIGNQQQVLRIDREDTRMIDGESLKEASSRILDCLSACDAIIFQDYDKGFLSPDLITTISQHAMQAGIPIAVDPKFEHFFDFTGCTLFKPNFRELTAAMQVPHLERKNVEEIKRQVERMHDRLHFQHCVVTLGSMGSFIWENAASTYHLPAYPRQVADVSGAGDTVISVLTLGLAAGWNLKQSCQFANLAGGLVCEEVGVVPVDLEKLKKEGEKLM